MIIIQKEIFNLRVIRVSITPDVFNISHFVVVLSDFDYIVEILGVLISSS